MIFGATKIAGFVERTVDGIRRDVVLVVVIVAVVALRAAVVELVLQN